LQAWVQTFPVDYYQELFRLRGLPFPTDTVKRPQYFGLLTNDSMLTRAGASQRSDFAPRFRFPGHSRRSANGRIPRNCLRMR
jgi:hypothetical protein